MKYVFGNWKMNMLLDDVKKFSKSFNAQKLPKNIKYGLAVPYVFLHQMNQLVGKKCDIGAENTSFAKFGEYTGEISSEMLFDQGVKFCLVGHSERRHKLGETDEEINEKMKRLFEFNITPVLCVGETKEEYEGKKTKRILKSQLQKALKGINENNFMVAYEPVWAIGTGLTPTKQEICDTIGYIKKVLSLITNKDIKVLYGGSVKPENVKMILSNNVDGVLVGGASLDAIKFVDIGKNLAEE